LELKVEIKMVDCCTNNIDLFSAEESEFLRAFINIFNFPRVIRCRRG